jgi:TatD DNase family protein
MMPVTSQNSSCNWVDSHCHFDFEDFDVDREPLWQSCRDRGINAMVIPGVAPDQWPRMAQLCISSEGLYYSVGLHPCWLGSFLSPDAWHDQLPQLREALINSAGNKNCVAIGECGLDQYIDGDPEQQESVLVCHLQVAKELDLPVILHCRRAHNELLRLLKNHPLPRGGVVHAFSGSIELARQYLAMGFYLGVGGTITYERANKTRNAIKELPLEALLLETDAPDMPLAGRQGHRNSPDQIPLVGQTLAQLRGESLERISQQTTRNAQQLFRLPL